MGKGKNLKTEYGLVDRAKLEQLQQSYDTNRLLDAVGLIDDIRRRICDPEGLRDELLELHRMAMAVVNENPTGLSATDEPIWSKATDLEFELSDYAAKLAEVAKLIEALSMLAPEDDWDEEGDESAAG